MDKNKKIKLSFINDKVLTFNIDDYMEIRLQHHIVGKLLGVPVSHSRNLLWSGLPAYFNEYEVNILVERGLATVENKKGFKDFPDENLKNEFESHQIETINDLHKPYITSRLESTRVNMDQILKGKRKKLLLSGVPDGDIVISTEDILRDETKKIRESIDSKSVHTQIPTIHPFQLKSDIVTDIPLHNPKKYLIFKHLWHQGHFITNGDSFGSDFLVYPGDPIFYHASQIVHVIDRDQQYDTKFLISCARLSVSVNKKCVFAYVNDDDNVVFQTLQWENPKLKELYGLKLQNSTC